ncbi:hypothetical protein PHMEG_00031810, partial [Phytophthora megakarya]
MTQLLDADDSVEVHTLDPPLALTLADGRNVFCVEECVVDLRITTAAGPVHVRRTPCVVMVGDEEDFLLGNITLRLLGIDIDHMLEQLAGTSIDGDAGDDTEEELSVGSDVDDELHECYERMLRDAEANGFTTRLMSKLRAVVLEYRDVWRISIGPDAAAHVEPYSVTLEMDTQPFRCKARKYPELQNQFLSEHVKQLEKFGFYENQNQFLSEHVKQLEKFGFVRRNDHSKWCCAAVPVRKPGSTTDFRITTDYRPVNRKTIPIAGVTPNLAMVTAKVQGASSFGTFDLFRGFWQMPLATDSQEIFSFSTGDAVYTPTRVPQGAIDSALHFQTQMQGVFRDMLYDSVLIWIDDIALYATDDDTYLERLAAFLQVLREYNLKLNAKKCVLFCRTIHWCGKILDGKGVQHDPSRLEALRSLPLPSTAAELQHLLCASNWVRDSLVDYARVVLPLQQLLTEALQGKSRKKRLAEGVHLQWEPETEAAFAALIELLACSAKLAFPDQEATLVLCTDASHFGWAVVLTQAMNWQVDTPVQEQVHELLVCKGGSFKGAQLNWSVIEKEAYPIIRACTDLEYLLQRKNGFRLYCDHANLIKVFCPDQEMKQHIRGKLQRWAMRLTGYNYEIEHIVGSDNVWADLVSRWGPYHSSGVTTVVKRVRTRSEQAISTLRPLEDEGFVWPSRDEVIEQQKRWCGSNLELVAADDGALCADGKLWIPSQAKQLIQRLLLIAHCGIQAHRGEQVMITHLRKHFAIDNVAKWVKQFLRLCLLCKHVKGGKLIQRPWSDPAEVGDRNEVLHMDFLSMGPTYGSACYLLVLTDELTHFCELIACDSASSEVAAAAVLDWAKRF